MKREELNAMSVRELRRYAIDKGLGITYLSERRKTELIEIILELTQVRDKRLAS